MFPNISRGIFNSPYFQGMAGAGPKYSTVNPFRTVDKIGQYGEGNNSSASQLYEYFRRGGKAIDHGLPGGRDIQSLESFNQRFNPAPVVPPQMNVPPPKEPTSGGYPGILPNFDFGGFNPANGIFNMQPMQQQPQMPQPQVSQAQQMDRPMMMPSGGPAPRQAMPMPNMNAGIFNMPQFNRR